MGKRVTMLLIGIPTSTAAFISRSLLSPRFQAVGTFLLTEFPEQGSHTQPNAVSRVTR
jgi:hypothetical protein